MQLISASDGRLRMLPAVVASNPRQAALSTGLPLLDAIAPGGAFQAGVIHEVLGEDARHAPQSFALMLARAAAAKSASNSAVVWCDPRSDVYTPALAAAGLPLERVLLLRVADPSRQLWAVSECLGCRGVVATVAMPPRLSRVQARRLQLAAERGGGIGVLLRQAGERSSTQYAAATRWLVRPAPGDGSAQRWSVELVHGHGGQIGKSVVIEVCRDTNHLRAVDPLADRSNQTKTARASA